MEVQEANETAARVVQELAKAIVGQSEVLEQMTAALLSGGHALVEGVPGTAKTLMARALARVTGVSFRRIQFTPDLMPSDILGVNMYHTVTGQFLFRPGPIFADIILADEINRSPAKTQSALLEAMQERQATIDGVSHAMSNVFTVFATQNPVEFEGTYPLPEAQVDRFMLKIVVGYPDEAAEQAILDRVEAGFDAAHLDTVGLEPVLDLARLQDLRRTVQSQHVEPSVRQYVTRVVRATRQVQQVSLGASPRSGVMLVLAAKAQALLRGRQFVTPDDVKDMAYPVLRHRLVLVPEAELEGVSTDQVIRELLLGIEVPR